MSRDHLAAMDLRSRRINQGLSPEQLGWHCNVSGHTIRRIEREGIVPTVRVQFALASHFGLLPGDIWKSLHRVAA